MKRKRRLADMTSTEPVSSLIGRAPVRTLDLHGLTAPEARRRVSDFIATCRRAHHGQVVRIVTGKGKGSTGSPVLMPLVRELLDAGRGRAVADFAVDVDGGSYLVRIG